MRGRDRSPRTAFCHVSGPTDLYVSATRPMYPRPGSPPFTTQEINEVRFRDRRLISLLLVALASAAALALSACGGGDGDSGDAKALLKDAFSKPIHSANVSLDLSAKIEGVPQLSQPITFKMTGPFESQGAKKVPKLDWDVNVSGGGQTFSGGLISTGDNAFVTFQGQNYEVATQVVQQYQQQLSSQNKSPTSLKQYGIDPSNWVRDAKEDGDEEVAGAATTKVT